MWLSTRNAVVAGVILAFGISGCPYRTGQPSDENLDRAGAIDGGIDEAALAGSSLQRAKRGLPPEEDGILRDVHFPYDGFDVDPEARSALESNAAWLRDNTGAKVELEGHCDGRGTIEYNLALGARRARAVKDFLLSSGVSAARLATISYGEELPVCHDENESCWQRNRRVHFVILGQ